MADPLLTNLCAICHIEPPKYKCPRCTIQTCSLACTKRHKVWSSCNGIRDATAYMPPSRLKTAAGVDHDFNFLSSIERAVQRSEKEIVEERQILRPEDLRPIEVRSVKWKTGKDGRKKRVLVTELLRGGNAGSQSSKALEILSSPAFQRRLDNFGILLRRAPVGMARQKENGTNFSKLSGRVNWQVEWLLLRPSPNDQAGDGNGAPQTETRRILAKAFDDTPLHKAFAVGQKMFLDGLARREQQQQPPSRQDDGDADEPRDANYNGRHKKRRKHIHKPGQSLATAQDTETGAWHPGRYCIQANNARGNWLPQTGVPAYTGTTEEEEAQKARYNFFVVGTTSAAAAAAGQTVVHAVDATVPLGDALRDMTILEYPTIYVVESCAPLPSSLIPEPKPVRLGQKRKRNNQPFAGRGGRGGNKRLRRGLEDGELPGDGEDSDGVDEDAGRFGPLDQIIAEESLGEDDDEDDGGSTTSSSGSDSGDDEVVNASLAAKLALLKKA
ncbi:HIT zinc finger [Colletotrichum sojae]|uniref:Box C/D snoRNA protein 1 n=1 Tax=Colletotrichum sojae TaxID=2175907 RepID=A0A8H6N6W3_9PEZI|nr:HIT zinc finger [Colletotrichum sojae]